MPQVTGGANHRFLRRRAGAKIPRMAVGSARPGPGRRADRSKARATALFGLLLAGCTGAAPDPVPGPDPVPETPGPSATVHALAQAPPGDWAHTMPPVLALGAAAVPALRAELAARGPQPGRQALVAALGATGGAAAAPDLIQLVQQRDPQAAEAALALARTRSRDAIGPLRAAVVDRSADTLLRASAAATLLELGEREEAVPFLVAVLLASTPAGAETDRLHGLPARPRWAHERHIAIDAIRQVCAGETFGLHPDAPWPRLEAGARRFEAALAERK